MTLNLEKAAKFQIAGSNSLRILEKNFVGEEESIRLIVKKYDKNGKCITAVAYFMASETHKANVQFKRPLNT